MLCLVPCLFTYLSLYGTVHINSHRSEWVGWYTAKEKRGIKCSYLSAPRHVELLTKATYEDLLATGRELFFAELPEADAVYYLAESSGAAISSFNPGMSLRQYF